MNKPKIPCYDGQNFFDFDAGLMAWPGDRHTTSATPPSAFSLEDLQRVYEAVKSLPHIPRVEFFKVPGSTDVAVMIDGDFAEFLTEAQFAELKVKLGGG